MKKLPGSNGVNPYVAYVEDADGLDKLEALQEHTNDDIYQKAVQFLTNFFETEEQDDQNLMPQADAAK